MWSVCERSGGATQSPRRQVSARSCNAASGRRVAQMGRTVPLVLALLLLASLSRGVQLSLAIDQNSGSFKVLADGVSWLSSGDTGFYSNGWVSTTGNDSTLMLVSRQSGDDQDKIGVFHYTNFIWISPARVPMVTSLRAYRDFPAVAFQQSFPQGLTSTAYVTSFSSLFLLIGDSIVPQCTQ